MRLALKNGQLMVSLLYNTF